MQKILGGKIRYETERLLSRDRIVYKTETFRIIKIGQMDKMRAQNFEKLE